MHVRTQGRTYRQVKAKGGQRPSKGEHAARAASGQLTGLRVQQQQQGRQGEERVSEAKESSHSEMEGVRGSPGGE